MLKLPGKIALAPMAGVTDRAFREICMEFGADYCITEMVSSKAVEQGNPAELRKQKDSLFKHMADLQAQSAGWSI